MNTGMMGTYKQNKIRNSLLLLLLIAVVALSAGCGTENENKAIDMEGLQQAMLDAEPALPEMSFVDGKTDNAADLFTYLSDLPYDKVSDYFFAYSSDGEACEIAVIAVKDAGDVRSAETSLQDHISKRIASYQTYAPEQVEGAENAIVVSSGNYAALIMCSDQDAVKKAFEDFVKAE